MSTFQFSTICPVNAKRFLDHESFNISQDQKDFILKNLGPIRVLDPNMHGGGKISIENSELLIEFAKLGEIDDSFMFKYCYLNYNFSLLKFGIEQGLKLPAGALDKIIKREDRDALIFLLENNAITEKDVVLNVHFSKPTYEFILFVSQTILKKEKITLWDEILTNLSPLEIINLSKRKILSINSLKYINKEKFNEVLMYKRKINKFR